MSDLVFLMGVYEAHFPTDRAYCTNHMWAQPQVTPIGSGLRPTPCVCCRTCISSNGAWTRTAHLRQRQTIGSIESKKAESELYAPADGQLVRFNAALLDDPSAINVDKYGSGWLFELQVSGDNLLSPEKYLQHLDSVWEITQRTIKGVELTEDRNMARQMAVVLSQGQSNNPAKRHLEETIVAELMMTRGFDVTVIPHLYDLSPDSTALLALQGLAGDFILLSWLYPRAAHWTLDRHDIRGRNGETALKSAWDERKKKWERKTQEYRTDEQTPRVIDQRPEPKRTIFHLDLRMHRGSPRVLGRGPTDRCRTLSARSCSLLGVPDDQPRPRPTAPAAAAPAASVLDAVALNEIDKSPIRRWYPVIDYSRCTNCMECIDFCLFGVYGIDQQETILVEQPDNCRKGCPACSRVCPENAIIFPAAQDARDRRRPQHRAAK